MKTNLNEVQKEKIKKAIEEWKEKVDHLLFPESKKKATKKRVFRVKSYVKSIYGRR